MTVINTNIKALYTQGALKISQRESRIAMQQLSTGKRINSAKDDAAGLAIAARMTQNIQSLNQSVRNAGDAISFIQTAEGATNDITSMLQRMSELAVQASNATYSTDQRGYLDQEFQQLKQEIVRIAETHEWNGFPILNGKSGTPVGSPASTTLPRTVADGNHPIQNLGEGDLMIKDANGDTYPISSVDLVDHVSDSRYYNDPSASAIAISAAINAKTDLTGVIAKANSATISGTLTTVDTTKSVQTVIYINGEAVSLSLSKEQTPAQRRQYVMDSINAQTGGDHAHGVEAGDAGNGGITLNTVDGRNLSVWYDISQISSSDLGLGLDTPNASNPPGVTGYDPATDPTVMIADFQDASTVYGTVTLTSNKPFTMMPGSNASPMLDDSGNVIGPAIDPTFTAFTALGFSQDPVMQKNIGRLSFQVGPSPDQLISIDMGDFGKNGDITGLITSDSAPTNINSVSAANHVIEYVNKSLDRVAATRATMGAVMNRLQHVIDNLTNVSMNEEASRSQIEDADYAAASTELARTQIMQQAATAVLAQANTDMQTVMKLLQ